jgi:hypothetical protein
MGEKINSASASLALPHASDIPHRRFGQTYLESNRRCKEYSQQPFHQVHGVMYKAFMH